MFKLLKSWVDRLLFKPCAHCHVPRPAKYHWDNSLGCDLCTEWEDSTPVCASCMKIPFDGLCDCDHVGEGARGDISQDPFSFREI